jgi:hypothetical protein
VLARLVLACRPGPALRALNDLAPADWLEEPTATAANEFGPA